MQEEIKDLYNKALLLNLPGLEHAVSSVSINLGIASIASVIKKEGFEVRILDLNLYEDYQQILEQVLCEEKPQFVGFGICTPQVYIARDVVNLVKNFDVKICTICGGPHPSALPFETMLEIGVDIVSLGEGDYTVSEIMKNYPNKLEKVKGICYYNGNIITKNPRQALVDINVLPFPMLELFEIDKYIYPIQSCIKNPVGLIETSRGCPGKCIFCSRIISGKVCRFKSAERVVDEFVHANRLGFQEIHLADDNFITDIDRAIEICELLVQKGLRIPWVPRSGVRVDYINERLLKSMRTADCYHIPFGIESTSQGILNTCNKGISTEQIEKAIKMAKYYDFQVTGYFMIGLPGQTVDSIKMDIDFAEKIGLDFVKFGVTIPYPGTKLFNLLKRKQKNPTFEWDKYHYATEPFTIYKQDDIVIDDFMKINIGRRRLYDVLNCVLDKNFRPIVDTGFQQGDHNE